MIKFDKQDKEKIHLFLLLLIILVGTFFRFFNTPLRYSLTGDSGRDALMAKEAAKQFQLPLTGSFSSLGPFTFGPWYYYILILSHFVIPSIWAPWIAVGLISTVMIFIMYKIGELLKNQWFGLILATLTAFSPFQVSSGATMVQHSLVGPLTALSLYLFLKIWQNTSSLIWGFLLGFSLGLSINMHYQAFSFLLLPIFFLFKKEKRAFLWSTFVGVFFTALPLLFFELNNHWFNTRNILRFFLVDQYKLWTPNRWLTYAFQFWPKFWSEVIGLPFILSFLSIAIFALIFTIQTLRRKTSIPWLLFAIHFAILVIVVRYWRGEKFFGYLQFFHPYIFLFMGYLLWWILKYGQLFGLGAILLTLTFAGLGSKKYLRPEFLTVETMRKYSDLKKNYPGEKFSVYHCHHFDQAIALTLYLEMKKDYSERGKKIGIESNDCPVVEEKGLPKMQVIKKFLPAGLKMLDLDQATPGALLKADWQIMSPKVVFEDVARWWFKLKP